MTPVFDRAEVICRAMGLKGFVEPDWPPRTLRLLLMPSFSPEVSLTLSSNIDCAHLSVVTLSQPFGWEANPNRIEVYRDTHELTIEEMDHAVNDFRIAQTAVREGQEVDILDGMLTAACLCSEGCVEEFSFIPLGQPTSQLVAGVLRLARLKCRSRDVRKALSECHRYLDVRHQFDRPMIRYLWRWIDRIRGRTPAT